MSMEIGKARTVISVAAFVCALAILHGDQNAARILPILAPRAIPAEDAIILTHYS